MPTIADQVATMEHDHAAALALIDQLKAANDALTSANTGLRNENVALGVEVSNMKHYVDDTRAMVETLASSAYDMLRTTRRQVDTPAEVIPFAPKTLTVADFEPAVRAYQAMQGDSGDEHFVSHDLYETGDVDAPDTIKDRNGEVVLGLCRKCGRGEIELADRCDVPLVRDNVTPLPAHAGPMLVTHKNDLPIFLSRDTPHPVDRAIFG